MDLNHRLKPYRSGELALVSVEILMMREDFRQTPFCDNS